MQSHVSNLLELAELVYKDATAECSAEVSDKRDLDTLRKRVKKEGISFLTITLPDFCKDLETCLSIGRVDPTLFRSFRKNGAIPAFLQGMLSQLFDRETGRMIYDKESVIREDSSGDTPGGPWNIVRGLRSFLRFFAKIEIECKTERISKAINAFYEIERDFEENWDQGDLADAAKNIATISYFLWAPSLSGISLDKLRFAHGPGATVEGISGNSKFSWTSWPDRFEPYFPLIDSAFVESAIDGEEVQKVTIVPSGEESPVKVTPVPKTLRGPRIIAIEPVYMQYAQQGLRRELYSRLESDDVVGGHVNFTDQTINQKLALSASKDGSFVTIDLSDASDRVPRDLALSMFDFHPDLKDAISACTSTHARLPDGRVIGPLKKFASMGNALCFPVEAMYFFAVCVLAILDKHNLPMGFETARAASRHIYVYGDDIIVPERFADCVLVHLRKYNCKVNSRKTFTTGLFRESCGTDAFMGYEVTPTYLRKLPPENHRQADRIISWVQTANHLYKRGYWNTSNHMFSVVERRVGRLPYVSEDSPSLGRITFRNASTIQRWNSKLHRFEFRGLCPQPVYRTDPLSGYAALTKSLSRLRDRKDPTINFSGSFESRIINIIETDPLHLERSALHGEVTLKRRWVPT